MTNDQITGAPRFHAAACQTNFGAGREVFSVFSASGAVVTSTGIWVRVKAKDVCALVMLTCWMSSGFKVNTVLSLSSSTVTSKPALASLSL